jgi:hypothetical protein
MRRGMIPEIKNIRRVLLLVIALIMAGLSSSNVFALDMMGPPTAGLDLNMFSGGLEYTYSKMDLELIEGKATLYRNGDYYGSGPVESQIIDNFKVNTIYATVGYGIFENCEAILRMGAANAKFGDTFWNEGEEFDNDYNFAIGAGFKATFWQGFDWKIGGLVQINRTELDGEIDSSSWTVPQPHYVEITTTEMQIAMGVTYMWTSRVTLYGGPYARFISGDFDYKFNRITAYMANDIYSWDINDGPTYGGYIGAQIKLPKNSLANFEYQHDSDADVFGANIALKY